jgi:beta-galactosidase
VRLASRLAFRDLTWLTGRWERLATDGAPLGGGRLGPLAIGPGEEAEVELLGPTGESGAVTADGPDGWLTLRFETAADETWAPAGTEIGWGQLELGDAGIAGSSAPAAGPLDVASHGTDLPPVALDAEGYLVHPLLAAGPRLALWRAPTDNDLYGGMAAAWERAGLADLRPGAPALERQGATTVVRREIGVGPLLVRHRQSLTPLAGGGVHVEEEAVIPDGLDDLPRVGTVLELVAGLEQVEWFGLGPHESYPDRKRSGLVGRWRSTAHELFTPYVRPQEAGGRADVRWLQLLAPDGRGVRLVMGAPMQVSAGHHRAHDVAAARHADELVPRPEVVVHLDAAHRGLGTASCGPDTTEAYLLGAGTYRWAWSLQPI